LNAFAELWRALLGWRDLLVTRPAAAEHFRLTRGGLVNATGFYFVVVLTIIALESTLGGFPGWLQVVLSLTFSALLLGGVWLVTWLTARMVRIAALPVAVPVTYAMAFVLLLSLPLVHLAGSDVVVPLLLGVRAFAFFRAAREMGKLSVGISAAFAILCIAVLAATPLGLYMLTSGGQGVG